MSRGSNMPLISIPYCGRLGTHFLKDQYYFSASLNNPSTFVGRNRLGFGTRVCGGLYG